MEVVLGELATCRNAALCFRFDPDEAVGEMLDEKFSTVGALQSGSSASLHNDKVAPLHVLTSVIP